MVFQCLGLFGGSGWADSANSGMFVSGGRRIVSPTVIDMPFVFEPPPLCSPQTTVERWGDLLACVADERLLRWQGNNGVGFGEPTALGSFSRDSQVRACPPFYRKHSRSTAGRMCRRVCGEREVCV
jgi:hypothetical protein